MSEKPKRSVANATRRKILKAATKLFAKTGFSGTSTLAIAKAADTNEALIFHHFGNKAKLWQQVKAEIISHLQIKSINQQPDSLQTFLNEIIQQRMYAYNKKPELKRIIQWQRLESDKEKLIAGNCLAPTQWLEPIRYLQKTKKIAANIKPEFIMIWLMSNINAVIFDDVNFFHDEKLRQQYFNFLIQTFATSLSRGKL